MQKTSKINCSKSEKKSIKRSRKGYPKFLVHVYDILENSDFADVIEWEITGRYFIVKDPMRLENEILSKHFNHGNFNSFIRQLNIYGFHKTRNLEQQTVFYHPLFLKNKKFLLGNIKRNAKPKTKEQKQDEYDPVTTTSMEEDQESIPENNNEFEDLLSKDLDDILRDQIKKLEESQARLSQRFHLHQIITEAEDLSVQLRINEINRIEVDRGVASFMVCLFSEYLEYLTNNKQKKTEIPLACAKRMNTTAKLFTSNVQGICCRFFKAFQFKTHNCTFDHAEFNRLTNLYCDFLNWVTNVLIRHKIDFPQLETLISKLIYCIRICDCFPTESTDPNIMELETMLKNIIRTQKNFDASFPEDISESAGTTEKSESRSESQELKDTDVESLNAEIGSLYLENNGKNITDDFEATFKAKQKQQKKNVKKVITPFEPNNGESLFSTSDYDKFVKESYFYNTLKETFEPQPYCKCTEISDFDPEIVMQDTEI